MDNISEYALKKIFPELPDPDDLGYTVDVQNFKNQAISLINKINEN